MSGWFLFSPVLSDYKPLSGLDSPIHDSCLVKGTQVSTSGRKAFDVPSCGPAQHRRWGWGLGRVCHSYLDTPATAAGRPCLCHLCSHPSSQNRSLMAVGGNSSCLRYSFSLPKSLSLLCHC